MSLISFYNKQSNKKTHNTNLHKIIIDSLDSFNENEITDICFTDLTKCLDTIDHDILLTKCGF